MWLSPLLLQLQELRGPLYQAASLPMPSVGSVAPGSLGMMSGPAFVLPFFYAYFVSPGFFVVQCVSLQ
jgi:hypothetical protein